MSKKKETSESESELTYSGSEISEEDELIDCTVRAYKHEDLENMEIILDHSQIFNHSEFEKIKLIQPYVVVNEDFVLQFHCFINFNDAISDLPKKFKKPINSILRDLAGLEKTKKTKKKYKKKSKASKNTSKNEKKEIIEIEKSDVNIFYLERVCPFSLEKIVEAYKLLLLKDMKYIAFVSKVYTPSEDEKQNMHNDFPEYKIEDFSYIPHRMEEILLLDENLGKKGVVLNDKIYRIFLLTVDMFKKFISKIEKEIENANEQ